MSDALRTAIDRGDYSVDAEAVALAMIARAHALRTARRSVPSEVLVAADRIEVRRLCAGEANPRLSLEGAA